jgi:hypothetical protein
MNKETADESAVELRVNIIQPLISSYDGYMASTDVRLYICVFLYVSIKVAPLHNLTYISSIN